MSNLLQLLLANLSTIPTVIELLRQGLRIGPTSSPAFRWNTRPLSSS
jgi:hypothetical protein